MRPRLRPLTALLVMAAVALSALELLPASSARAASVDAGGFVQREGDQLTLAGAPFRFSGTNMYWLALDDNVRDSRGRPTQPSRYRIDDAMATTQLMGGTVVRAWANSVGCPECIQPQLGSFNPRAFTSLDYAIASAARHDQRLVLSLVDNWSFYHGSKRTYADWRGVSEPEFFTDPRVIGDYKAFITEVLTHRNPYTGLEYREDPTIMGWQTGNEMWCEGCVGNTWDPSWTRAVADHIKQLAPDQLVVDGHGTDPYCTVGCLDEPSLSIDSVDVVDDHHYPMTVGRVRSAAAAARAHDKAYLVGEYDWAGARGGDHLSEFLDAVDTSGAAGALFWGLIPHDDTAGFVDHDDGFQYFYPGRDADERARTLELEAFAARMSGPAATGVERPEGSTATSAALPPRLRGARNASGGVDVTWRGAAGAATYTVQRRTSGTGLGAPGPWTTVAEGVTDQRVVRGPLMTDANAPGAAVEYRARAVPLNGPAGPWSRVVTVGTTAP